MSHTPSYRMCINAMFHPLSYTKLVIGLINPLSLTEPLLKSVEGLFEVVIVEY